MEYERQERGILLLLCAVVSVISLILFPASESVKKVVADPIVTTVNNTVKINKTNVNNPESNNSLIINNNPIYQASGWTVGLLKLKSAGFSQEVESIFENGIMNGVGKVTNLEAWIFSPIGTHGFGHGVITTKDKQMITWTAHDISGTNNKNVEIEIISNSCYEFQLLMVRYIILGVDMSKHGKFVSIYR